MVAVLGVTRIIAPVILILLLAGCAPAPVRHFKAGKVVVLHFVEDQATVQRVAEKISSESPGGKITAHFCEDTGTIVISARDFTPEALARELARAAGEASGE